MRHLVRACVHWWRRVTGLRHCRTCWLWQKRYAQGLVIYYNRHTSLFYLILVISRHHSSEVKNFTHIQRLYPPKNFTIIRTNFVIDWDRRTNNPKQMYNLFGGGGGSNRPNSVKWVCNPFISSQSIKHHQGAQKMTHNNYWCWWYCFAWKASPSPNCNVSSQKFSSLWLYWSFDIRWLGLL